MSNPRSQPDKTDETLNAAGFWTTIFSFLRPYRKEIILSIVCAGWVGVTSAVQALFPKWLIDDAIGMTGPDGLPAPADEKIRKTLLLIGLFLAICASRLVLGVYGYRQLIRGVESFLCDLRGKFFRHVQHLCLRFHDEVSSGELFNYIMGTPTQSLKMFLHQGALMLPIQAVSWVVAIITLSSFSVSMTLITIATVVMVIIVNRRSRIKIRELGHEFMKTESNVSKYVADMLRGSRAVKMYAIEDDVSSSFDWHVSRIRSSGITLAQRRQVESVKVEGIRYVSMAIIFAFGVYHCLYKDMTTGVFFAFITSSNLLMQPLMQLMELNLVRANAEAGLERITRILQREKSTEEQPANLSPEIEFTAMASEALDVPCVQFKNVSFAYTPGRDVISDLDMVIPNGQTVALAGPSGSGKSTFITLLLRLYDPQQGSILLNGADLRSYSLKAIRSSFGVVPQDPYIFQGSIRDNIRVTRADATDEEIAEAMEISYVSEFVSDLPKGADTFVGEGGSSLSGGQRQRIAIARAVLAKPRYYIFDEATSALDNRSEKRIQQAMESLTKNHTSFIIAHRLSTIRNADRVLVFDNGKIVQDGRYENLANTDGLFSTMLKDADLG